MVVKCYEECAGVGFTPAAEQDGTPGRQRRELAVARRLLQVR